MTAPLLTTACQKDYRQYFDIEWDEEVELHNGRIIIAYVKKTFERVRHMRYYRWRGMREATEISFDAGGQIRFYKKKSGCKSCFETSWSPLPFFKRQRKLFSSRSKLTKVLPVFSHHEEISFVNPGSVTEISKYSPSCISCIALKSAEIGRASCRERV